MAFFSLAVVSFHVVGAETHPVLRLDLPGGLAANAGGDFCAILPVVRGACAAARALRIVGTAAGLGSRQRWCLRGGLRRWWCATRVPFCGQLDKFVNHRFRQIRLVLVEALVALAAAAVVEEVAVDLTKLLFGSS